jgi:hypothetical protein
MKLVLYPYFLERNFNSFFLLFLYLKSNVKHHRAGHTTEPATFVLALQVCLTQLHFHRYQIMTQYKQYSHSTQKSFLH